MPAPTSTSATPTPPPGLREVWEDARAYFPGDTTKTAESSAARVSAQGDTRIKTMRAAFLAFRGHAVRAIGCMHVPPAPRTPPTGATRAGHAPSGRSGPSAAGASGGSAPRAASHPCDSLARGDQESVQWLLLTTLSVNSVEEAQQCVIWYTHRWRIERYHFTLNTALSVGIMW